MKHNPKHRSTAKRALFLGLTVIIALLLTFVNTLFAPTPVYASVQSFYFEKFEADYYVTKNPDGTSHLRVHEVLTAVFPDTNQNHGITRSIPRTSDAGRNITATSLGSLNLRATRNGQPEKIAKTESTDDEYTFYFGDASEYVHGIQVYTLDYEFNNAVLGYNTYGKTTYDPEKITSEELYWDTNGTGWSQSFEELIARVHFEGDAYAKLSQNPPSCYVGRYGSKGSADDCLVQKTSDGYEFRTTRALQSHENLTFDIEMAADTFTIKRSDNYLLVVIITVLTVAFTVITILALRRRAKFREKREFYKGSPVPPEYQPYEGMSVAEAAMLRMKKTKSPEVATLMDLAVKHKIELIKGEKQFGGRYDWKIKVLTLDDVNTDIDLKVLRVLNHGEDVAAGTEISVGRQTYSSYVASIAKNFTTNALKALKKKKLFEEKASEPTNLPNPVFLIIFLGTWGVIISAALFSILIDLAETAPGYMIGGETLPPFCFLLFVLCILVPILLTRGNGKYKARTMEGLRAAVYLDGLDLYMRMAEQDRINFLQSVEGADTSAQGVVKLYEKLLPYAVLFGYEDSWMAQLNAYYQLEDVDEPSWYHGVGPIVITDFHSLSTATSRSLSSATVDPSSSSSSGSSGSSGGGFSGGGGGGGGGGGW